jgi:hypothetical protein
VSRSRGGRNYSGTTLTQLNMRFAPAMEISRPWL